jgi:alpha-galactosidase
MFCRDCIYREKLGPGASLGCRNHQVLRNFPEVLASEVLDAVNCVEAQRICKSKFFKDTKLPDHKEDTCK